MFWQRYFSNWFFVRLSILLYSPKNPVGENLKHSEKKSRGYQTASGFALPSASGVTVSHQKGTKVLWSGPWVDVTIFQMDLIWAAFCKNDWFGLAVDIGWYSAVTRLMRLVLEMKTESHPLHFTFSWSQAKWKQGCVQVLNSYCHMHMSRGS